jgi:anti-sigma-K factor RskA
VRYTDPRLREALAAEYALGTLQAAARRRFERALKSDPQLRRLVAAWQDRLVPLDALAAPVQPPARVWRAIKERIEIGSGRRTGSARGFWASLGFWRGATIASTVAAMVLAVSLAVTRPPQSAADSMVVVMSDETSAPAMTISWPAQQPGPRKLRIRLMRHADMPAGTAWELWMLPGGDGKPVSLGLINTAQTQELIIPSQLAPAIDAAWGLAMSVEPAGGSPTGLPTGQVLYKGQCTLM